MSHNSPNPDSPGKSSNKLPVPAPKKLFRLFKGLRQKNPYQPKDSPKLRLYEDRAQIERRARAIWKARKDDGKITAEDDWYEAIAQLKAEYELTERECSFPGKRVRGVGRWIWRQTGLKDKTLWDLFQALLVPITLVVIGFALQEFADQRDSAQQEVRRQQEQALADDKARQDTLVRYLAEMSDLLEKRLLRSSSGSERVIIAQAKTITALQSLDAKRQNVLIQFLEASSLNTLNRYGLLHRAQMAKSDFRESDLSGAVMIGADLREAKFGCLFPEKAEESERQPSWSDFLPDLSDPFDYLFRQSRYQTSSADLLPDLSDPDPTYSAGARFGCLSPDKAEDLGGKRSSLRGANLRGANLNNSNLAKADFRYADLTEIDFRYADLSKANLSYANLTETDFRYADVADADFSYADLSKADLRNVVLLSAKLDNAILLEAKLGDDDEDDPSVHLLFTLALSPGQNAPFLCATELPANLGIDSDRDCHRLPAELVKRYPNDFPTLNDAEWFVESFRNPLLPY